MSAWIVNACMGVGCRPAPVGRSGPGRCDTKSIGGHSRRAQRPAPHPRRWNHPSPSDVQVHGVPGIRDAVDYGGKVETRDDVEAFAALLRQLKDRTDRSYGSLARRLNMNTST